MESSSASVDRSSGSVESPFDVTLESFPGDDSAKNQFAFFLLLMSCRFLAFSKRLKLEDMRRDDGSDGAGVNS